MWVARTRCSIWISAFLKPNYLVYVCFLIWNMKHQKYKIFGLLLSVPRISIGTPYSAPASVDNTMPKFAPLYHHMLYNFGNAISFSIYYQKMHIHRLLRRRLHKLTILQCIEIIFFGTCIFQMNSKSIWFEHEYFSGTLSVSVVHHPGKYQKYAAIGVIS